MIVGVGQDSEHCTIIGKPISQHLERLADQLLGLSRLQGTDAKRSAEVRQGLIRDALEALHVLEAGEDDFEALACVRHEVAKGDDRAKAVFGVGIQELVGLVQHDDHPLPGFRLHRLPDVPGNLLGLVRGDAGIEQFLGLEPFAQVAPHIGGGLACRWIENQLHVLDPGVLLSFRVVELALDMAQQGGLAELAAAVDQTTPALPLQLLGHGFAAKEHLRRDIAGLEGTVGIECREGQGAAEKSWQTNIAFLGEENQQRLIEDGDGQFLVATDADDIALLTSVIRPR